MSGPFRRLLAPTLLVVASACSSPSLTLAPQPQSQPQIETAATSQAPVETVLIAPGTPTGVYALVARGALGCWFGADGPLKPTHVFEAAAEPPANGGAAEIVLYERDESLRDKRGARAFRVAFATSSASVRVGVTAIRMEPQLGKLMIKDVEVWAQGGSGCQVRTLFPPPPPAPAVGKGRSGSPAGKRR
jgi:hypothetical protein